ncbi:SMI1/KNR4 family protein [Yinghuangia soli]|uniref:SMI1/KNR4 family protein n=1 Tax=Yinghuangia soli TaxID=2908204 RepID=A0AA41Q4E5_9ACTN|nr:SMI1/KNR4 family protein [Yinghuangia soli]MCF2530780.1 SMI1/KNR4 family protein [Yinghuangia soli]
MMIDRAKGWGPDMVEHAAQQLAEAIVAHAPTGWTRAILTRTADYRSVSAAGNYSAPDSPPWGHFIPSPFTELDALAAALREARGWERVSIEIECRPSGRYRMVAATDAVTSLRGRGGGFLAVLDPGHRLVQPGAEQEEGTAQPLGDPHLAAARFHQYMEQRQQILGRPEPLPPAASAAEIDDAEHGMGRALPADLRALYLIADGDGIDHKHHYVLADYAWLRLADLVAANTDLREPNWFGWEMDWDHVVFDADPPETVRRCGGHPGWLPFASGEDGNYLAVDMAPARDGRPGQVIRIGRDYRDGPTYVADSVTSLLGHHLEALEETEYELDGGDDEQQGAYLTLPEPDPVGGPREVVGAIPDDVPSTLQAIHINDAGLVDLAPLTAAPGLRRLHLNRSATADLSPLRGLPVEALRVTLDGGDLAPLAGHRHLAALELAAADPINIAPLCTIPGLRAVDLARAEVLDLTVLSYLTGLRYLALNREQWAALLGQGLVPPKLAAVRLADDDALFDEALAWSSLLGLDSPDAVRAAGNLGTADR